MITAKEVKLLDLSIDGKSIGLFREDSEWNGMRKLYSLTTGDVLIISPLEPEGGMSNCFDGLFAAISGIPIEKKFHVICASPDIALILKTSILKGGVK